ncbi:hypothetical protein DL96DRAFT_1025968 [Flagelloscypha sp. PMI_526]|nr:hypothetical protein DL96DRAFT_1025968 [Flagelloscypha sp. PMI_526]
MHRQNSFLRRRAGSFSSIQQPTSQPSSSIPFYSNVLSHKCRYLEVLVYSPEMTSSLPDEPSISVFGERDRLGGQVILHPGSPEVGRINITVEGSFYYPASTGDHPGESFHDSDTMRKSVFLSTTHVINVVAMQAESQLGSKATMLNAFGPKRRPSVPSLRIHTSYSSEDRSFPFALDLPRGARPGEDKPGNILFFRF